MAAKSKESDPSKQKECFVIMPITDPDGYPKGHFAEVYSELIRPAVEEAGFSCTRADDVVSSNLIHLDVVTRIVNADLCICDLSSRNPNVLFEYGIRQAFDKPTVLIKDSITERIFDVSNFRDIEYDHTLRIKNILLSRTAIISAINATLNGGADDGQVFSLVKLMGLTQAAKLPVNELDTETAHFQILGKRIEAMQDMLQRLDSRMRIRNERAFSSFQNGPSVRLMDGHAVQIFIDGELYRFNDYTDFLNSTVSKKLDENLLSKVRDHLIPF